MNIFSETVEREMNSVMDKYFSKIKDDGIYVYLGSLQDNRRKRTITDINKTLHSHHFIGGELCKYLGGMLSIMVDKSDIKNRTKQWINDIRLFMKNNISQH